ncbi:MAG TPA: CMD domain protein [Stellaceae bacterium]|jgi:CMD domain protein|nr:CMD domain protein [Stellaceae bacterium]
METDVIDTLVGIAPGSALDAIRARRKQAREQAQASYRALFAPDEASGVSGTERFAVAVFATGLHGEAETAAYYKERLVASGAPAELRQAIDAAVAAAISAPGGQGPYGSFPAGPLSREDAPGPTHRVAPDTRLVLGKRLATAFEHMHMLVFHPRDAAPAALQPLLDAGWSTTDIVTLSQITSFLAFQIRVVAGLRVLSASI